MNKIKIFFLAVILVASVNAFSQPDESLPFHGDLKAENHSTHTMKVWMEAVSIPYEGLNEISSSYQAINRYRHIQAGTHWRMFYENNGVLNYDIYNIFKQKSGYGDVFDFGFAGGAEFPNSAIEGAWGFAKYKVTIEITNTGEIYTFYWNSLDSKYGTLNGINIYGRDFYFIYEGSLPLNRRVVIYENNASVPSGYNGVDTISTTDNPIKHLKIWELIGHANPLGREFNISSTPFPVILDVAENYYRDYIVGTTIVFDTIYKNLGSTDKNGYNTQNDPYYETPDLPSGFSNVKGNIFFTPGGLNVQFGEPAYGIKITAESGDTIILKRDKKLFIYGQGFVSNLPKGDTLQFLSGSHLKLEPNAQIIEYNGGILRIGTNSMDWSDNSSLRALHKTGIEFFGTDQTVNDGGSVVIDDEAELRLANNTILTFDGANTRLELKPKSKVTLGSNAKLVFKNGAKIIADSVTFTSSSGQFEGIVLENANGNSVIEYCTFTNAITPIRINNDSAGAYNNIKITNNTFNNNNGSASDVIHATNAFKMLIQDNTFNIRAGKIGLYIRNYYNPGAGLSETPGGGGSGTGAERSVYSLNIIHNTFNSGAASLIMAGYASELTPYYVYNNSFNTASTYNIIGRRMKGDIKNNSFNTSTTDKAIFLHQSSPNLLDNNVTGDNALYSVDANPILRPITGSGGMVWIAGLNDFTGSTSDVVSLQTTNIQLDNGRNTFTRGNTAKDHIYGKVNAGIIVLYARQNCWYPGTGSIPEHYIWRDENTAVPLEYQSPGYTCGIPPQEDVIVTHMGNGVYDTAIVTDDISGSPADEDDLLYASGVLSSDSGRYFNAITYFKSLIDNYESSDNLLNALDEIYECYENLDTFATQSSRNIHYGNLKTYLEDKIASMLYSKDFEELAYSITLLCATNMQDYDAAVTGFEFLSLYHPSPETRLMSTFDLEAVEDLIETGSGGGAPQIESSSMQKYVESSTNRVMKKLDKAFTNDPILRRMKESFVKENNKREKEYRDNLKTNNGEPDERLKAKQEQDTKIIERAKENMAVLKSLSREEKEKRITEDLFLIGGAVLKDGLPGNTVIPDKYSLSQNYPNPFNPVTTISYSLPKEGLVRLKVYDITGREVAVLLNEFKPTGSYNVQFDGSRLSSGVYFYRLEAGQFAETKRMVLVK